MNYRVMLGKEYPLEETNSLREGGMGPLRRIISKGGMLVAAHTQQPTPAAVLLVLEGRAYLVMHLQGLLVHVVLCAIPQAMPEPPNDPDVAV